MSDGPDPSRIGNGYRTTDPWSVVLQPDPARSLERTPPGAPSRLKPPAAPNRRQGAILLVAMWVLFFLAALVLVFARSARMMLLTCANQAATVQASAVERGAEQYVLYLVDQQKDSVLGLTESYFAGLQLEGGYFWILRPNYGENTNPALGLVDESSKLNLNTATADMLQALPGFTADIAASIIDWRDADSEATAGGAEDDYYLARPQPYRTKNSPLETVEEMLLIKGVTPDLLYGTGTGSRYGADPTWGWGAGSSARTDLELARGIYDDLTVYSNEPGAGAGGGGQVNVNDENPQRVTQLLSEVLSASRAQEVALRVQPRPPFRDVFDFAVRGGLTPTEFNSLVDRITTGARTASAGLINVNTAPREVLMCLPGLGDAEVSSLLSQRPSIIGSSTSSMGTSASGATAASSSSSAASNLGWVFEALGAKSVGLASRITTHSYQYSADILAASLNGKAFRRCRLVIDAQASPPKIIYRRDLTQTGWPLDPAILLALRAGRGLPAGYSAISGLGGGGR